MPARHEVAPVAGIQTLRAIDWNHWVLEKAVDDAVAWAVNFWRCCPSEHRGVLVYDSLGLHQAGGVVLLLLCVGSLECGVHLNVNEVGKLPQSIGISPLKLR